MTQSLTISTGVRLAINNDEARVITFDPDDAIFAEKFYKMIGTFQEEFAKYRKKAEAIESQNETDSFGIPLNAGERVELLKEICTFTHGKIDELFGVGTSKKVFENSLNIEAIIQFFDGVKPFVQSARADKVAKYTNKTHQKRK